jgi:PTS system nitrogen regulatory IIA component
MLSEDAAGPTGLDQGAILTALRKREALGSTGVDSGIALPHSVLTGLARLFGLLALLDQTIDHGAVDTQRLISWF